MLQYYWDKVEHKGELSISEQSMDNPIAWLEELSKVKSVLEHFLSSQDLEDIPQERLIVCKDMIEELPYLNPADPASRLRIPVDPRTKNGIMPPNDSTRSAKAKNAKALISMRIPAMSDMMNPAVALFTAPVAIISPS